jgi:hypothetical protein
MPLAIGIFILLIIWMLFLTKENNDMIRENRRLKRRDEVRTELIKQLQDERRKRKGTSDTP